MGGKPSGGGLDRRLEAGGQCGHARPVLQPRHLRDAPAGRDHRRQLRAHGGPLRRPPRAGQPPPGRAPDLRGARRGGRRRGGRAAALRHPRGRPRRHLGAQLRRVGRSSSTRRRRWARSSSTSTRPIARTSSSTCCASPACGCCSAPARSRPATTRAMIDEVAGARGHARADRLRRPPRVGRVLRRRARPRRDRRAHGRAVLRRPDQHPVHERDDRLSQGRDALAPQHPQQRLLRHRAARRHRARRDVPAGALLPLLRHGHGQPRRPRPRRQRGHPGAVVRAARDARGGRGRGRHLALRRADDVHRHARPRGLRLVRPRARCAPGSWPARRARSRS